MNKNKGYKLLFSMKNKMVLKKFNGIGIFIFFNLFFLSFISGAVVSWKDSCCADCALPWVGIIQSDLSKTAYLSNYVECGSTCTSETRTCNNGTLSGSYTFSSCSVGSCCDNNCYGCGYNACGNWCWDCPEYEDESPAIVIGASNVISGGSCVPSVGADGFNDCDSWAFTGIGGYGSLDMFNSNDCLNAPASQGGCGPEVYYELCGGVPPTEFVFEACPPDCPTCPCQLTGFTC